MLTIEYDTSGAVILVAGDERLPLLGFNVRNTIEQVEDTEDDTLLHDVVTRSVVTFEADFSTVRIVEANAG